MSCQVFNGTIPKGVCAAGSDNSTFLVADFKKCCGPAPVVYAYCPIVSNGPSGSELQDCLAGAIGIGACNGIDDFASPSALAQASAMASATVCAACAVAATTTNAAATSTNAAIGIHTPDAASWKIVFTIGVILSIGPFTGFLI
ncbi:hypothetical protein N5P37_004309 [Trichoderma harzianum]|uniref:Uncharacterized protein n=1 Tax=Trichoderma harzianum CBS 226.95 TaxID=983964 RepID=A0A2T4AN05_TRIHA|nr:hypothetical protein M431DRAFT_477682 [Trichoderma harzianum CBS 226.95]KAK0763322.1 hypothetical protein N5P37_004309 [Trichoderma harzianum]PTB58464.1 hypothetical protein M431DRAFT_477682 [Trichoderma harzianum CBS 226.95]